jgi:hypothetical protein
LRSSSNSFFLILKQKRVYAQCPKKNGHKCFGLSPGFSFRFSCAFVLYLCAAAVAWRGRGPAARLRRYTLYD